MHSRQVEKFVDQNKFPITPANLQSRCVDGRPAVAEQGEYLPAVSKPGSDVGDLMIALGSLNELGLKIAPEKVLEIILENNGGVQNFKFHTDSHTEDKQVGPGLGCGHINKATIDPEDYHLTSEQTEFIKNVLPSLLEKGAKQVVLHGDHEEQAVLVVLSSKYGVRPYTDEAQAFIYQQTLHQQQLDSLAKPLSKYLASIGQEIDESKLRLTIDQVFAKQLGATLSRIAKGLPMYKVEISDVGDVQVENLSE